MFEKFFFFFSGAGSSSGNGQFEARSKDGPPAVTELNQKNYFDFHEQFFSLHFGKIAAFLLLTCIWNKVSHQKNVENSTLAWNLTMEHKH